MSTILDEGKPLACLDAICAAIVLHKIQACLPRSFDLTRPTSNTFVFHDADDEDADDEDADDEDADDDDEGDDKCVCVLGLILARGGELCLLLQPLE